MTNQRHTRFTDAFSKKITNHAASVALRHLAYNFIKVHRTLRVAPEIAAGVKDHSWDVTDLLAAWQFWERRNERPAQQNAISDNTSPPPDLFSDY